MNFDATVTIGDVLQILGVVFAILTGIVTLVGSRIFVLRRDFEKLAAAVRQSVQDTVGPMALRLERDFATSERHAEERHTRATKDFERIERQVVEALTVARAASDSAIVAIRAGERAELTAANAKEHAAEAAARAERQIESLNERRRSTDGGGKG